MITITGKLITFGYSAGLITIYPTAHIIYKFSKDGCACLKNLNIKYALKFSPTVNNPPAFFKTSVIGIWDGAVFLINVSNL